MYFLCDIDALVWEKLKLNSRMETQAQDQAEEFEDDHGNVYNRRTYEDLKRQGLL